MNVVIDTSAIMAVILGEPERDSVIRVTVGYNLIAPGSMTWEIGNAFSAMFKRQRISLSAARVGLQIYKSIPIRFVSIDLGEALTLAAKNNIYGYDSYFLVSAMQYAVPLLTLDNGLKHAASNAGIPLMEV